MTLKKNDLGKTGLAVTPVGFGVLPVGHTQMNLSIPEGAAVLRYALDAGINFMDTAQYYKTYPYIREALKGFSGDTVIASKCLDASYDEMAFAIEECRQALDRDVIDIFLLHEVRGAWDWEARAGAWACLQDAKAKGIIKATGISTHHVDAAALTADIEELDVLFPLINFKGLGVRKGNGNGTKEEMAAAIEAAHKAGKGVFAMKVFGGGNLTPHYKEALDYVCGLPGIDSMMIGFGHNYEIDHILAYLENSLSESYTPPVSHKKVHIDQGDCEGCGRCLARCPNHAIFMNEQGLAQVDESVCLTCGYCAPQCPVMAIILY